MTDRPTREEVDAALAQLRDEVECCGTADCTYCGAVMTLLAGVSALRASEKLAWDHVNYPTPSAYMRCYPHKAAWIRGAPDEGCPACKLEARIKALIQAARAALDETEGTAAHAPLAAAIKLWEDGQ